MAANLTTPPIITKAGLKLATMRNNQHLSLNITHVSFGTSKYNATGNETSLKREKLRAGISSSTKLGDKTIQMRIAVKAPQGQGFWCNEIGFWDGNTLFAIYSSVSISGDGLIFISDKVETTISFSLALDAMPIERITVQIMQDPDRLSQMLSAHENDSNPHPQYSPLTITANTKNQKDLSGHTHEINKASTKQAGIVQLTSDTNSESETLGLTAKAGKTLKALIDALTRNLGNYIPNSKKSNAINSPSSDTVATSNAVKLVSDKIDAFNPISRRDVNLDEQTSPIFFHSPVTSAKPLPTAGDFSGIVSGTNYDTTQLLMEAGKIWVRGSDYNPISSPEHWSDWVEVLKDSHKSDAINEANSNKIATSKAVYDLNGIKLDKVGGEAFLKTIDYTKANGYTYSGFYRPNGAKLNNLPLNGLMMLITHPGYSTNAHARGICFAYGGSTGNVAWDIFTTAFDASGNHLGQKRIMTELGGTFAGNVSVPNLTATGTLQSNYRLVIDRNEDAYPPYISIIDRSIDLDNNARAKEFTHINFITPRAGELKTKAKVLARTADDKSADIRLVTTNDADRYTYNLTLFGQTGNVAVGKTADNGVEKLQVAGTIGAVGYINTTSAGWERIRATLPDGSYWRWEVNPASATDPRFNYVYRSASGEQRYLAFPTLAKNETVAYQSWVNDKIKSIIPVGAVVAFPSAVQNPQGFLRCDGSTFSNATYPDLYRVLGNKNKLPDLRRSDVGMTAYFATDNIPDGWIAFDDIRSQVTQQRYPELYRYLVAKYGSISAVPLAEDRFIRNAGAGLNVGQTQADEFKRHAHASIHGEDQYATSYYFGRQWTKGGKYPYQVANAQVDGATSNQSFITPNDTAENAPLFAGGDETRPKSLILKLCIKAKNSLDDVQFWIRAFGAVGNAGELDASRLAQDLQGKANLTHTHTASQITDFDTGVDNRITQLFTYQKIGNFEVRKYPDGTMIQTCFDTQASKRSSSNQLFSLTLPVAFVNKPVVSITIEENVTLNTARDDTFVSLKQISNSQIKYGILDSGNLYQTIDCVHIIAIGRWK